MINFPREIGAESLELGLKVCRISTLMNLAVGKRNMNKGLETYKYMEALNSKKNLER